MSTITIDTSSTTTIQTMASSILEQCDTNEDGQFSLDEFATFLDSLLQSLTNQQATSTSSTTSSAAGVFLTSADTDSTATSTTTSSSSSTAYRDRMLGFDYNRFESAKGTLKYDAANIMQGIDPSSSDAMQTAYTQLAALHPGEVSLDSDGNLMLDGTADGYIGVRPLDRSEDWSNAPSGYVWQWMAYNEAHPGPAGETS
jgi:hypothetical protein